MEEDARRRMQDAGLLRKAAVSRILAASIFEPAHISPRRALINDQRINDQPNNPIRKTTTATTTVQTASDSGRMGATSCQTFVWGGNGVPVFDDDGQYSCSCADEMLWTDHNIIGLPSCVPAKVHLIFGWIGLLLSLATFCHSAYHLRRQLEFHRQQPSASTTAAEKCRRQFHIFATAAGALGVVYFGMVLEDELRWSLVVFSLLQIPVFFSSGILCTRMWTYTNDPVLMRDSPEVLAVCTWLESPAGQRVTYAAVSVLPISALALTASGRDSIMAVKLISGGIVALCVFMTVGFTVCGRSLLRAIDESLLLRERRESSVVQTEKSDRRRRRRRRSSSSSSSSSSSINRDPFLLKARAKVKLVVIFVATLCAKVASIFLFAISTEYGAAAPLLFFLGPMTLVPPIWNLAHVQLHEGRTRLRRRVWTLPAWLYLRRRSSRAVLVVPGDEGANAPNQQHHQLVPTEKHSASMF